MITFSSIQLRQGASLLLDNASATINPGQKVGLVGQNGCGKSTLLSLIKGEMQVDAGTLSVPSHWSLAWVNQETPALDRAAIDYVIDGDRAFRQLEVDLEAAYQANNGDQIALLHQRLEEMDGWTIQSRAAALMNGLGFSQAQINLPVKSFSGGWRMRLNLAQALICRSDLLLLDEPTNHLDLDAVMWLEKWLQYYPGTLILISHDRDFLDPLINKIIHIEQQTLHEYTGNYSSFEQQRAMKLAQHQASFEHQQQKIAHLQHYIDRFKAKASKAKQAQSRIKMLEKMETLAPAHVDNPFHFTFRKPDTLPQPILKMAQVSVGYQDKTILEAIKLNLVPGSRIGLLGRNGAGKSTLIKLLAGEIAPSFGTLEMAKGIKLGYFAQHQLDTLRAEESPLWHMTQIAEPNVTEQALRNYLGGFDFRGDKVTSSVRHFSGGEKARLVLALIVWQRPNLLLLDEPTNHLDLEMRQALTEALLDFEGAMVIVSHDRHLLRLTTDEFYLVHDQQVVPFDGDLEDYQKWLAIVNAQEAKSKSETPATPIAPVVAEATQTAGKVDRKEEKRKAAERRAALQPLKKQIASLEAAVHKTQTRLSDIETQLADPAIYDEAQKSTLTALLKEQHQLKSELETLESDWFEQLATLEQLETAEEV